MADPLLHAADVEQVLDLVAGEAKRYLATINDRPVREQGADDAMSRFDGALPEDGVGSLGPVHDLLTHGMQAATHSAGPRFFHFVIGGGTPAALGADWITSLLDQNGALWPSSPMSARLEQHSVRMLLDLFALPVDWGGTLTPSATYANFAGLAAARHWWGEQHGRDVDGEGFAGLPAVPVLSSGHIHMSARKALGMLGIGRDAARTFSADPTGTLDADAMEAALRELGGAPAIIVGNAGEVNAGAFDDIARLADLAERHNAWLHVDGAFGLFGRITPRARSLSEGIERAHSVASDGHKWLNVPYDCGFVFVRDVGSLGKAFAASNAAYLPKPGDPNPSFIFLGPDSSRRARSLMVWATLRAYGRAGHRAMVERHLDLAQHLAARVEAEPSLELLAEVPLNIVCFRVAPEGTTEDDRNALNARLGEQVLADGRVFVGTTTYGGKTAFRPAIVNWRTTEREVDLLVDVILELARA